MINSIHIKNFMVHSNLSLQNIPQINLIIGKNDTGKTGILKLLYATLKSLEIHSLKQSNANISFTFRKDLADKLIDTFMPIKSGLGELVQKGANEKLDVNIDITGNHKYKQNINFSFGERTEKSITNCTEQIKQIRDESINALFIPAKEILTAFSDIRNIRNKFYGVGFDDTYLDLINSLDLRSTKGKLANELSKVNKILEDLFEGKIEQTGNNEQPFIFKKGNQQFSMQQTAEGIKKIGILNTLINNRELRKGTVLFMDEPETALHPEAIRKLVEMLVVISEAGVQIFLATHNYFIIKQLAICAKRDKLNALCWNFAKEQGKSVQASFHDLIDGVLPNNSIIEESVKMFDQEIDIELNS